MKFTRKEYDAAGIPTRRGEAKAKPPEPMRICTEAEAEEWPQLRARIASLEAERDRLREALAFLIDRIRTGNPIGAELLAQWEAKPQ